MLADRKRRVLVAPEDPVARYDLGEALFQEGDLDGAEKQLTRALALDPACAPARRLLSRVYRAQERPIPAERALDEAVLRDPADIDAREELADLLTEAGRYDEAILHLEAALRAGPGDHARRLRTIDLCLVHGLIPRAERHIDEARRHAVPEVELLGRKHAAQVYSGHVAGVLRSALALGAEALFARTKRALEAPPFTASAAAPLRPAIVALRERDLAAAKRALVTAPAEARGTAAFELLRGEIALLSGDRERAAASFERAAAVAAPGGSQARPGAELAVALARVGELALASGSWPAAEAALAKAAAILGDGAKPTGGAPGGDKRRPAAGDPEVLELLGDALLQLGRRSDAAARYEAAMEIRPDVLLSAKIAEVKAPARKVLLASGPAIGRIGALAWNPTGGIVSPVQAEAVPGRGELRITGNVHGTGVEAARVVASLLKARARSFGIEAEVAALDLHLHYADADFRKEGASAGIALALAALSAYRRAPLPPALAATGQITLDGAVTTVAGLGEKLLAAYLCDVRTVIAPRRCLFTIRNLPPEIGDTLRVIFVDSLREAVDAVWEQGTFPVSGEA